MEMLGVMNIAEVLVGLAVEVGPVVDIDRVRIADRVVDIVLARIVAVVDAREIEIVLDDTAKGLQVVVDRVVVEAVADQVADVVIDQVIIVRKDVVHLVQSDMALRVVDLGLVHLCKNALAENDPILVQDRVRVVSVIDLVLNMLKNVNGVRICIGLLLIVPIVLYEKSCPRAI